MLPRNSVYTTSATPKWTWFFHFKIRFLYEVIFIFYDNLKEVWQIHFLHLNMQLQCYVISIMGSLLNFYCAKEQAAGAVEQRQKKGYRQKSSLCLRSIQVNKLNFLGRSPGSNWVNQTISCTIIHAYFKFSFHTRFHLHFFIDWQSTT